MDTREKQNQQPKTERPEKTTWTDDKSSRPPAFDDLRFIVKATLTIGARMLRELDKVLTKLNS